tara:strand:+ start:13828 stop:14058 length:231 start_codon:yes stop_codon:yes gene_type:complete
MRLRDEIIEVAIDFDTRELNKTEGGRYIVKWFDNTTKEIMADRIRFSVRSWAQALNDVAVIRDLNPHIKSVNLKIV